MFKIRKVLPVIVVSQFFCTSMWFAGNAVMADLVNNFSLGSNALGHLTAAVQLGFILGTLVFAVLTIADRFSPSRVFFICALLGALFNAGVIWQGNVFASIFVLRFLTGFFLAGIYPVGMKIAADYFEKGLGKSLGFLVGALTLGTAFPHILKSLTTTVPWSFVMLFTSSIAVVGGLLMLVLVPNGPFRKPQQGMQLSAFFKVFNKPLFRSITFGYFGHMWELYTFWAFVPVMLKAYNVAQPGALLNVPVLSFFVIGIGSLACVLGGYLSQLWGAKKTASIALFSSGVCCLVSPLVFQIETPGIFVAFLLFWGMVVIADSPLFSTLVAQNAPVEIKGTALTIVNCIGFSITIISIQLINLIHNSTGSNTIYTLLAVGPILGLIALWRKKQQTPG
jgi:MFS family permease